MAKTIFVDLDGVLVDFVAEVCTLHNYTGPQSDFCGLGASWMERVCGDRKKMEEFWDTTGSSVTFWSRLRPTVEYLEILEVCEAAAPGSVGLLSSGACRPEAFAGKMLWVQAYLPLYRKHLFVGSRKELFAHGDAVLIDDWDENVSRWKSAGGHGILYPRPWNSLHGYNGMSVLRMQLEAIINGAKYAIPVS